jgi:gamma-glutamyl phosphate reductase
MLMSKNAPMAEQTLATLGEQTNNRALLYMAKALRQ